MLELLIERQRSERQTQIGKFFFQTHHRLHQLTDQNHSIQILWLAEVQRLTCPLWVKSGHLQCKSACPLYPRKQTLGADRREGPQRLAQTHQFLAANHKRQACRATKMVWGLAFMFITPAFAQGSGSLAQSLGSIGVDARFALVGAIVLVLLFLARLSVQKQSKQLEASAIQGGIVIRKYQGSQERALRFFQEDSIKMATKGLFPISQSWIPGQWGAGPFIIALLLCVVLIGIVVFIYLLIVKPPGTLTVTYERRAASAEEKTCPRCAERIKAAALVCHFCGNEFPKPPLPQDLLVQKGCGPVNAVIGQPLLDQQKPKQSFGILASVVFVMIVAGLSLWGILQQQPAKTEPPSPATFTVIEQQPKPDGAIRVDVPLPRERPLK
jgi:Uncharacterised protein family UPF0547